MNLPIEWYIASRYIRANPKQSAIIALAVGIGVAIIIFIPSVNLSFFNDLLSRTVLKNAHITVTEETNTLERNEKALQQETPPNTQVLVSDKTQPRRRNIAAYRRLLTQLRQLPQVSAVAPYIKQQIIVVRGGRVASTNLNGIVPEDEKPITRINEDVAVGNIDTLSGNEVFLGWRLADELRVKVGQRIQLVTSQGTESYKVTGLIKTGIFAQDRYNLYASLKSAQSLLNMPNEITGISIRIKDYYKAKELGDWIAQAYHLKAQNWMEENEVLLQQIANFKVIIGFISFLIVFAAATSITSVLIMVVASKSREIGILKSMGMVPGAIMRLFLIQAIFLSLLGAASGVLGGIGLIALFNATPFARAETFMGLARQPATLNIEYTVIAIVYAMVCSFLASLIPAWQAGRLDPVKNINP